MIFRLPLSVRIANRAFGGLEDLGVRALPIDADRYLASAIKATGCADLGELGDGFRVLCRAFEAEANLSLIGRIGVGSEIGNRLRQRLRIIRDLSSHPEIHDEKIVAPVFIVGLPRTGTTMLHKMLATDPKLRAPANWELLEPSPPSTPSDGADDPRIQRAKRKVRALEYLAPSLRAIHSIEATAPDECYHLYSLSFTEIAFNGMGHIPSYIDWLTTTNWLPPTRFHRDVLKLLQWKRPAKTWVLKAPAHLSRIAELLAVYPDARFIWTHRPVGTIAASGCSLQEHARTMLGRAVDPGQVGRDWLRLWGWMASRAVKARSFIPPAQLFDLTMAEIVADPRGAIQRAYRHLGLDYSPELDGGITAWVHSNPVDKHGAHKYSLERYGLTANVVDRTFEEYMSIRP
ncbi:MAG TPA: sulfotransferase [bacterium]|nr:sulfotransferase [bacterium]